MAFYLSGLSVGVCVVVLYQTASRQAQRNFHESGRFCEIEHSIRILSVTSFGLLQQENPIIVSINSDNQLVLQNLALRTYGARLCDRLSKYEQSTMREADEDNKDVQCITFENFIWENWSSKNDQMKSRRVMLETIRFLEELGYRLVTNFKVKKRSDCFFFERGEVTCRVAPKSEILFLSFIGDGEMALVGDPLKSEGSPIPPLIQQTVMSTWSPGVTHVDTFNQDYDLFDIAGSPWKCLFRTNESSYTRLTVARIFEQMLTLGWMVSWNLDYGIEN